MALEESGIECPSCIDGLCSITTSPKKNRKTKYWRYTCRSCGFGFGHHGEALPKVTRQDPATLAMVRFVLLNMNTLSNREIGQKIGHSRKIVAHIAFGRSHRNYAPELPRKVPTVRAKTCRNCALAKDPHSRIETFECSLGTPEAAGDPQWGQYCPAFTES
jgi:hypothetical protein